MEMIITKSISRFARNTVTLLSVIRELKALGVDVFFEEQKLHTMSADGELMLTVLGSYAQEESLSASENQKWRIRKNFSEGKPWDATILGYRVKDGQYVIEEDEAAIVRRIYSMYLEGRGMQAICNIAERGGRGDALLTILAHFICATHLIKPDLHRKPDPPEDLPR